MNYSKLKLSFFLLLIMSVLQFLTSLFILHHMLLTLLSVGAIVLCLLGLAYIFCRTK